MGVKKKRLTLDLEPTFQRRLKVIATLKGVTMRQYCYTAIDRELSQDEARGITGSASGWSDADRFEELQKKHFGDRVLTGSGAVFIREARDARDARLKGME